MGYDTVKSERQYTEDGAITFLQNTGTCLPTAWCQNPDNRNSFKSTSVYTSFEKLSLYNKKTVLRLNIGASHCSHSYHYTVQSTTMKLAQMHLYC